MRRKEKKRFRIILKAFFYVAFFLGLIFIFLKFLYPLIPNFKNEKKGEIIRPVIEAMDINKLRKSLEDKGIELESLESSSKSGTIIGKIKNGPKVFIASDKDVNWQVSSLHLIISRLTIDNKKPNSIDLRYPKPIVKY